MTSRWAARVSWTLVVAFVAAMAAAIYVGFNPPSGGTPIRPIDALWALSFVGFPITGALVATRFPERPLGWLLCVAPLLIAVALILGDTGVAAATTPAQAGWFGWAANAAFTSAMSMLVFVPLFLPDGLLPGPRWRVLVRAMLAFLGIWTVTSLLAPGPLVEFPDFTNPVGVEALGPVFRTIEAFSGPILIVMVTASATSPIVRFRRSSGYERQQLKWLAFGAGTVITCFLAIPLIETTTGDLGDVPVTLITMVGLLAFPTAIAVSILRYRLYDIDVIVNRTLVYGALTAVLAGAYSAFVVGFQRLLAPITQQSDVAIAASTLAVAGLFGPLRRRIQSFIDRRFYRSRYDAQQTLETFSAQLRNEVDLDHLTTELLQVVSNTVRPRHASLWLRERPS